MVMRDLIASIGSSLSSSTLFLHASPPLFNKCYNCAWALLILNMVQLLIQLEKICGIIIMYGHNIIINLVN